MNEEQQKAVDDYVKVVESFWGPVVEELSRQIGWTPEQVWMFEMMSSMQRMQRLIEALTAAYNKVAESQQELKPKADKLMDLSLEALESEADDWKKDATQE